MEEWSFHIHQANDFRVEVRSYNIPIPRALAIDMLRSDVHILRKALYRIREENNRIKIYINRYYFMNLAHEAAHTENSGRNIYVCLSK